MDSLATPGHRALRTGRVSLPNHVYIVTAVTEGRTPVFLDSRAAAVACRAAFVGIRDSHFLAWVVMPDHFHGLLQLGEVSPLSEVMRCFKGGTAIEINRLLSRRGRLWQASFHDRAVRRERDLETLARYIIENPLRAGIVTRVGDYPFWSADWDWDM